MKKNDVCEENSQLIHLFDNYNAQSHENFMDKMIIIIQNYKNNIELKGTLHMLLMDIL
jgi:hypothetical protein